MPDEQLPNLADLFDKLDPTFWKKGRLETYKYWPFDDSMPCNAESMSAAGFFCIGGQDEPDLVECFMCNKQLNGWEASDDPWEEHKKHQANCPYIQSNKSDELSFTITELIHLAQNYSKQKIKMDYENAIKEVKENWKDEAAKIPKLFGSKNKK